MSSHRIGNPMPHVLDVNCPACRGPAAFAFAVTVKIQRRDHVAFFANSSWFEYRKFESGSGERWHGAVYRALLHGPPETTLRDLPAGYKPSDWGHGGSTYAHHETDEGAIACAACGHRARHRLRWPADARFQIDHRGRTLWAYDRESAHALRQYVAARASTQEYRQYLAAAERDHQRWARFLRHVPTTFLTAKARATVVKQLDRLLG